MVDGVGKEGNKCRWRMWFLVVCEIVAMMNFGIVKRFEMNRMIERSDSEHSFRLVICVMDPKNHIMFTLTKVIEFE